VGYFAEPMVCYREHDLNITHSLLTDALSHCTSADIAIPRIIKSIAERAGFSSLAQECVRSAAHEYVRGIRSSGQLSAEVRLEEWSDHSGLDPEGKACIRTLVYQQLSKTDGPNFSPAAFPATAIDPTYLNRF